MCHGCCSDDHTPAPATPASEGVVAGGRVQLASVELKNVDILTVSG